MMQLLNYAQVDKVGAVVLIILGTSSAFSTTIDFETPSLGSASSQVINPYVDAATGVVFVADQDASALVEVIGLVKNSATSACVPPANADQKLGTTVEGHGIGMSNWPIVATFPDVLPPPAYVSMEVQGLKDTPFRLTLYDANDNELTSVVETASVGIGSCYGGNARARLIIGAFSWEGVAKVRIEQLSSSVFVVDDVTYFTGNVVCGDTDGDREVTTHDLELLKDAYISTAPELLSSPEACDLDCDGVITIADVVLLAGYVYGYGPTPCCAPPPERPDQRGREANSGPGY